MPDPVEIALVIDRAVVIAREKGVDVETLDLRHDLALRLFRELRWEAAHA